MSPSKKVCLFLLITFICVSNAKEYHFKCDTHIPPSNVCHVRDFELSEDITKLVLDNPENKVFTAVSFFHTNPVFADQLTTVFPHAENISIFSSDFSKIDDNSFKDGSHLKKLEITYTKIQEITEHTFTGADNLVFLNLQSNEIKSVHPKAFYSTPKLFYLTLQYNQIETLDKDTFAPLKNLEYLYLQHNLLTSVDPKLVVHNQKLSRLALGDNKFSNLELELSTKHMVELDLEVIAPYRSVRLTKLRLRKAPGHDDEVTTIEELRMRGNNLIRSELDFHNNIKVGEFK